MLLYLFIDKYHFNNKKSIYNISNNPNHSIHITKLSNQPTDPGEKTSQQYSKGRELRDTKLTCRATLLLKSKKATMLRQVKVFLSCISPP